jgi:hypothetical protein
MPSIAAGSKSCEHLRFSANCRHTRRGLGIRVARTRPSPEQRTLVGNAAAFGVKQELLAANLGISDKTLRKYFRAELDGGMFKAHMVVGKGVFAIATQSADEKVRADMSKFYLARKWAGKRPTSTSRSERTAARSKLGT